MVSVGCCSAEKSRQSEATLQVWWNWAVETENTSPIDTISYPTDCMEAGFITSATRWTCEEKEDVIDVRSRQWHGLYSLNTVTPDCHVLSCSCSFLSGQLLPYHHLFKVASHCSEADFCDTWVPMRWQLSHQVSQATKLLRSMPVASAACPPSSGWNW